MNRAILQVFLSIILIPLFSLVLASEIDRNEVIDIPHFQGNSGFSVIVGIPTTIVFFILLGVTEE